MKPGFIYCFLSLRFGYFKIGLSGTPKRRLRNIRETIKEYLNKYPIIIPVFIIAVWDMDSIEDKIHTPLKKFNFTWVGSGKTEWHKLGLLAYGFLLALLLMLFYQFDALFKFGLGLAGLGFIIWIIRNL